MTTSRIDFYIRPQADYLNCQAFACQLAEKAYLSGHNLRIFCQNKLLTQSLDQQLWQFQETSFVPHTLDAEQPNTLIVSRNKQPIIDIQLNLQLTEQAQVINHPRLLQIVPNNPQCLQLARQHYAYYKSLGYKVNSHQPK